MSAHSGPIPAATGVREEVTAYHWLVVIIASAGWLFDCMDQRLFILARESALTELLGPMAAAGEVRPGNPFQCDFDTAPGRARVSACPAF